MILDASAPLAKVLIEDGRLRAVLLRFAITAPGIFLCSPTDDRYWPSCACSSSTSDTGAHHTTEQLRSRKPVADDNWVDS
jgi:hypothetical protein